jgi:hypothetical protein
MSTPISPKVALPPTPPCPALQTALANLKAGEWRHWLEVSWRFSDEQDCLASFIALETAEVLAGVKPANLIRVANRTQLCGRNLFQLWKRHSAALLRDSKLRVCCLRHDDGGSLMLFYRKDTLLRHLRSRPVARFLRQAGFDPRQDLHALLAELRRRFRAAGAIPHEIGLFLGYPVKDVAAYMGYISLPCTACQGWRIYGNPKPSLALKERFVQCRQLMADRLSASRHPGALLREPSMQSTGFGVPA